ncbi:hypothetical protein ACFQ12_06060, partial [Methylobacterium trifolii]
MNQPSSGRENPQPVSGVLTSDNPPKKPPYPCERQDFLCIARSLMIADISDFPHTVADIDNSPADTSRYKMIVFRASLGSSYNPASYQEYFTHADTNRSIYVGPYSNSPVYGRLQLSDNTIVYTGIIEDQNQVGFTGYMSRQLQTNDGGFYWDVSGNTGSATLVGGDFGDGLRTGVANDTLKGGFGNDVLALLWQIEGTGQVFVDSCAMAMVMGA